MDLKCVHAIDDQVLAFANVALPINLSVVIRHTGSHSRTRQVQNEPRNAPEVPPVKRNESKFPACPVKISTGPNNHRVTLMCNPSVTPNHSREARYCLYRSRGPVKRIKGELTVDKAPCSNCELV